MRPFQPNSQNPAEIHGSLQALWRKVLTGSRFTDLGSTVLTSALLGRVNDLGRMLRNIPNSGDWSPSGSGGSALQVDSSVSFTGTGRLSWTKVTADSVTLAAGTSSDTVTDLQTFGDGNSYDITEAAATPGIDLIVDFINVSFFHWVQIVGIYQGNISTHAVSIQLYNWSTSAWDTFEAMHPKAVGIYKDHSFFVPDATNYVGAGDNDGKARVRFNHTMGGSAAHGSNLDVVALYH